MIPVNNSVFVELEDTKNTSAFEVIGHDQARYKVTAVADDITTCKPGDFILFDNSRTYKYGKQELIVVNADDIIGVDSV